jgi:hypothetical protein
VDKPNQNLADRLTRADSWLRAAAALEASKGPEDLNAQTVFIYRYIAFNSLYGRWKYEGSEKNTWTQLDLFFEGILTLNSEDRHRKGVILRSALAQCQSFWLQLIENEFLDNGYWAMEEHRPGFKAKYRSAKFTALKRLNQQDYKDLLHSIFSRVVVLRNQILHGCATFGRTSLGWKSVETTNPVLRTLIPAFHLLMTQYPGSIVCPPIPYPRLGSAQHPKRPLGI